MKRQPTGIAIVGMACTFPGAPDLQAYHANLQRGTDAITEVPPKRWDPVFFDPSSSEIDRFYCRRGGFIGDQLLFDPLPYGIMPVAAEGSEPDQMLALDLVNRALKDAGMDTDVPRERTAVILGRGGYIGVRGARATQHFATAQQLVQAVSDLVPGVSPGQLAAIKKEFLSKIGHYGPDTAIGLVPNIAASRIANRFDFQGPAYTIDAACASSLIAVDQASRELESERADLVIAGGMHLCDDLSFWNVFTQLGAISRSQQIRPLDRRADGLLIGEGAGILVLKRLADALRDDDRIYAVVKGCGLSSDGRERSLMDPRSEGQILAVKRAWQAAGLDPASIGLLEAHGTGTPTGDRAELTTLAQVFGAAVKHAPGIGSVKSMIGHTMPASGAASLIKTALALHYGFLPPTLHCEEPHELLARSGFRPIREAEPWEAPADHPRRAAVNAFGFGGINSHVVLEAAPGGSPEPIAPPRALAPEMLFLAADSREALLKALESGHSDKLSGSHRLVIQSPTPERREMAQKLVERGKRWSGRKDIWYSPGGLAQHGGKVAFLFPGVDGRFNPHVEDVARHFHRPLPRHLDPQGDLVTIGAGIVEVGLMLHGVLADLGVRPDAIAGHSIGEWTGMLASGLSLAEEADRFIDEIVPAMSLEVPGVLFGAVGCGVEQAGRAIADLQDIAVSHDNCPHQSILCGVEQSMDIALQRLKAEGVLTEKLSFRSGFHSPLFREYLEPLAITFSSFSLGIPETPMWSATRVSPYPSDPDEVRQLWIDHLLKPVRFRELIERLYEEGVRVFIQLGTGRLMGFVEDSLRGRPYAAITANAENRAGLEQLRRLLAELWCEGYPVRLQRLGMEPKAATVGARPIALELSTRPVHFEHAIERPAAVAPPALVAELPVDSSEPVLAELALMQQDLLSMSRDVVNAWNRVRSPRPAALPQSARVLASPPAVRPASPAAATPIGPRKARRVRHFSLENMPFLIDHSFIRQPAGWPNPIERFPVVPFTMSIDLVMEAARELAPGLIPVGLERIRANRWIEVTPPEDIEITAEVDGDGKVAVSIGEYFNASVLMARSYPPAPAPKPLDIGEQDRPWASAQQFYDDRWMFHGPGYHAVTDVGPMGLKGLHGVAKALPARGSLLDAAGQIAGYWCACHATENQEALPFRVDRVQFYGPHPQTGTELKCDVHILEFTDLWGRFDIDMHRDGRVWVRIEGWEDRRFESDPQMRKAMLWPEFNTFAQPTPEGLLIARETWRSASSRYFVARRWLDWEDMQRYSAKNPRAQRSWLLGRIAAKDAVRRWLWDRGDSPRFPIEIRVQSEDSGRPRVSGPFSQDLRISIAHSDAIGVAMVTEGRDVGVDVERIAPRDPALIGSAFTEAELALLPGAERDEWLTRLWVAKESVGKLRGTGLAGKPRSLKLSGIDGERLRVDGVWVSTRRAGEYVIGWTVQGD